MNKTLKSKQTQPRLAKKSSASQSKGRARHPDLVLTPTKNSWDSKIARQAAILNFCIELHKDAALGGAKRTACKTNEQFAKNFFASIGGFYQEGEVQEGPQQLPFIPTNTCFKVFENKKDETDWIVTIVLPAADQPFPDPFIPNNFWRCTWVPY
jgi:hypothetical protein